MIRNTRRNKLPVLDDGYQIGESLLIVFFVFVCVVYPCSILGYLISVKQQRYLIAGWRDEDYKNPSKAAAAIGGCVVMVALIAFALSLLVAFKFSHGYLITFFVVLIIVMPIATLIYVNRKYGVNRKN